MPLYEYSCQSCDYQFEELVFPGDEVICPKCQGKKLIKNLSLPAAGQSTANSIPFAGGCGDPNRAPCGSACRRLPSNN